MNRAWFGVWTPIIAQYMQGQWTKKWISSSFWAHLRFVRFDYNLTRVNTKTGKYDLLIDASPPPRLEELAFNFIWNSNMKHQPTFFQSLFACCLAERSTYGSLIPLSIICSKIGQTLTNIDMTALSMTWDDVSIFGTSFLSVKILKLGVCPQ